MATTPVFLPGESHGQRSLVGYSPWGRKESDTSERLDLTAGVLSCMMQIFWKMVWLLKLNTYISLAIQH